MLSARSAALVVAIFAAVACLSSDGGALPGSPCEHCRGRCVGRVCRGTCAPFTKWRLYKGKCLPRCSGYCLSCTSFRQCLYCRRRYSITPQPNGDNICRKTPVCDPNCISGCIYKRKGRCDTECKLGYGLTSDFKCAPCDTNCDISTAPGCKVQGANQCDQTCKPGYFLDNSTYLCLGCDMNCNATASPTPTCSVQNTCDGVCNTGYVVDTGTSQCSPCAVGCDNCTTSGPGFCDGSCQTNYVYVAPSCAPCDSNCISGCTVAGECGGDCQPGFGRLDTTVGVSSPCGNCDSQCDSTYSGCNVKGAGLCDSLCLNGTALDSGAYSGTYLCTACQLSPCRTSPPINCTQFGPGTCTADDCLGSTFDGAGTCYV